MDLTTLGLDKFLGFDHNTMYNVVYLYHYCGYS